MLAHVPSFERNPRGPPDFLAYPVPKACMHVIGTGVRRCLGVARSASSPKAAQALRCSLIPGLRISFGRVTCMAWAAPVPGLWTLGFLLLRGACVWVWVVVGFGFRLRPAPLAWGVGVCVCLCVCSACTQPLLASGARCGCVCLGSGFGCAPPLLAGVLGCVRAPLAPSHSWPRVRGVGVCVWARVSAAPHHSWLECWAVCVLRLHRATPGHGCAVWVRVFGLGFQLRPATPGWGVGLCACSACTQPLLATGARCGCVCLDSGFGCAPPLLAGVLGCVRAPLAPSHSWPRVRGVGVCVWARVSAAPRHSWLGCWAVCVLRMHPATPGTDVRCGCVCLGSGFSCAPPLLAGVLGCVCAPLAPSHSWPRVRGVGVCVWARVSAAPRHSWLGCWAVCVLRLHPATPGTGARCGCVCLGSGFGCAPPLLAGLLGCVRAPLAPSHSWPRVRGVGVCAWTRVSAAPRHSWLGCWAVCVLCLHPATPGTGVRCGCVCLGSGFGYAPPLLAGVLGCVCAPLAPSHSWPRLRGVGVCVWTRVSAALRHCCLGCWAVCVLRLHPATPGTGARCGCVCWGSGFGCAPPLPAGVLGCVCAPLAPNHSWLRVRGVGVCVWARVSAAPRHSWLGCWAVCVLRLHPATPFHGCAVWVRVFGLGFRLRPATPGWGVGLCACSACTQPLLATGARSWCVCLGSGFGCAPPLLAGLLGCVRGPLAPSHSWP